MFGNYGEFFWFEIFCINKSINVFNEKKFFVWKINILRGKEIKVCYNRRKGFMVNYFYELGYI